MERPRMKRPRMPVPRLRRRMAAVLLGCAVLGLATQTAAQEMPTQLHSFAPTEVIKGSSPEPLVCAPSFCLLRVETSQFGFEPWRSDGTANGTLLLKDINPSGSSLGSGAYALGVLGGTIMFTAWGENGETVVWSTDGTGAGTRPVTEFPAPGKVRGSAVLGGTLLFSAPSPATGTELWRSDGTDVGTAELVDLLAGPGSSNPSSFAVLGAAAYFFAAGSLWRSDATASGTSVVAAVSGHSLTRAGNLLYFFVRAGTDGSLDLWRSDGSGAGTVLLVGGFPDSSHLLVSPRAAGTLLFFRGYDEAHGWEPWRSDGTLEGTRLARDVEPGAGSSSPEIYDALGGSVLFSADTQAHGRELWRSDGSEAGTVLVKDVAAGAASSYPFAGMTAGSVFHFVADDGAHGYEPWRSDGTSVGTFLVKDVNPGGAGAMEVAYRAALGKTLLFKADDGTHGDELWRTDGTAPGTALVANIESDWSGQAGIWWAADVNGTLVLEVGAGTSSALWRSRDATTAPYFPLPGYTAGRDNVPVATAGKVFFRQGDAARQSLWRTDATAEGTFSLGEFGAIEGMAAASDGVYFVSTRAGSGWQLFRSDGTRSGTRPVMIVGSDGAGELSRTDMLAVVDDVAYFVASDPAWRQCLWRSDGTPSGTRVVKCNGGSSFDPQAMAAVGSAMFFVNALHSSAFELWRSDGTEAGTRRVRGFDGYTRARLLTDLGWAAAFLADAELWRSDGTEAGTVKVANVADRVGGVAPAATVARGRLYFAIQDWAGTTRVWTSDGSTEGTHAIANFGAAPFQVSEVPPVVEVGGWLFLAGYDALRGIELWRSDGAIAGTKMLADVLKGEASSRPRSITRSGDRAAFIATDAAGGIGLWAVEPPAPPDARRTAARIATGDVSSVFGGTVAITAAVEGATRPPAGSVRVLDGGALLATLPLLAGAPGSQVATARYEVTGLTPGVHEFLAEYLGNGQFSGSTSLPQIHTVTPAQCRVTVSSSPNPAGADDTVELVATVVTELPVPPPQGTVTFLDAAVGPIGEATLDGAGVARVEAAGLPGGTHFVRATFGGEARFLASASGYLPQAVVGPTECPAFVKLAEPEVGGYWHDFVAAGDITGDGRAELLTSDYGGLLVFPSDPNGLLGDPVRQLDPAYLPRLARFGDLNGDGRGDAVIAFQNHAELWLALATAEGSYRLLRGVNLPNPAEGLALADLDHDGDLDILADYAWPGEVFVVLGSGDGTFAAPIVVPLGEPMGSLAAGDVDGDGNVDAVLLRGLDSIGVLYGNGDGSFGLPVTVPLDLEGNQNSPIVGDFDGDGRDDVALIDSGRREIIFLAGTPTGPGAPVRFPFQGTSDSPLRLHAGDFDGDGATDLAASYNGGYPSTIELFLGPVRGSEWPSVLVPTYHKSGLAAPADFNGDGKLDLAVSTSERIGVFLSTCGPLASTTELALAAGPGRHSPATLTVRVRVPAGTPAGTVTLREGGAALVSARLGAGGAAMVQLPFLPTGTHVVVAEYLGSPEYLGSSSPPLAVLVEPGAANRPARRRVGRP